MAQGQDFLLSWGPGAGPSEVLLCLWECAAVLVKLKTKPRSRRPPTRDKDESKVIYDVQKLQFPWCVDWDVVDQARRNADWVRSLIREYGPERISVQPVIVVPGWYVESGIFR